MTDKALRLVLTYRGREVRLDQAFPIDMRLPASDELPEHKKGEQLSGFWYELQDKNGRALYRRVISDPIKAWVEIPDEEVPGRLRRLESIPEEETFVLLVPALKSGTQVVLFSSPIGPPSKGALPDYKSQPAKEMWRIQLPQGR